MPEPLPKRRRKESAGILLYRRPSIQLSAQAVSAVVRDSIEVFLVHPGGPFWAKKDFHSWSIPKGEYTAQENPRDAAIRELEEETGFRVLNELVTLGEIKQAGGKFVTAFACEVTNPSDFDPANLRSNTFQMEWPPKSGKMAEFPEVDRAAWFTISDARERILKSQLPFLDRLQLLLK